MPDNERVVYSINVKDLQGVAKDELGRELTHEELASVELTLGDFIDWYGAIANAIHASARQPV